MPQMLHSSVTLWSRTEVLGLAFSNAQEFLCFQTSQDAKIISELSPFIISLGTERQAFLHQLEKRPSEGEGTRAVSCRGWRTKVQICLVKTQPTNRCWMVSSSWSQKGQTSGWGNSRLARRSAVHHCCSVCPPACFDLLHCGSVLLLSCSIWWIYRSMSVAHGLIGLLVLAFGERQRWKQSAPVWGAAFWPVHSWPLLRRRHLPAAHHSRNCSRKLYQETWGAVKLLEERGVQLGTEQQDEDATEKMTALTENVTEW